MVRRKKVETKHIDNEEARQVCFSKRRQGLFNKALELSVLCGAMVSVVIFSMSGKSYSIGYPSIDAVINRFLALNPPNAPSTPSGANQDGGRVIDTVRLLCQRFTELHGLVDEEMKRKDILQEAVDKETGIRMMQLLTAKTCDLGKDDLQELYTQLEAMHGAVFGNVNQVMAESSQTPSSQPQLPSTDIATASKQYLFVKPSSQPHPFTDIASSSQYQSAEQSVIPMSVAGPSSTNGSTDGFQVNDHLFKEIYGLGGSENFPNNQNLG